MEIAIVVVRWVQLRNDRVFAREHSNNDNNNDNINDNNDNNDNNNSGI